MRIAISGQSGCGNTTATSNVGKALKLKVVNYTFRDLAQDLSMNFDELHKRAEDNFIFDYLTDLTLISHANSNENIVIGTRLAAWLMNADLRIWLHAPLETRAHRIARRESEKGSPYEAVLYKTLKRDQQNRKRYLRLYGVEIDDHNDFDITINTEMLTAEQVSSLIVAAAQWAETNLIERSNDHKERIQEIIAENLEIPLQEIKSPHFKVNPNEIYQRLKHKTFI